ncbi:redoxin family protein [Butyricicoccus faecihominis]|uniref:cytochrome c biogenesis protein/redoxin n=1 Tax=Butyricicoccus faecihominis TaxID=1712515 RepID=UPI00247AC42F|nr:cytochrome c biogenesis protein/redoxin [Butyricicoccus faecihominis]MCQ5128784.1 redoxin family protein [Butyricicoccus faecihominis]
MGFTVSAGVPALTVFLQGILSFFSPCVLPLVPLYVGYLAGGAKTVDEDGTVHYPRRRVLLNTLFFVLGVSFTFFLLGFGFTALGRFFSSNRAWFARISGIIMVLFGLYQFGVFGHANAIERERRLPFRLDRFAMNPAVAFVLGFTFSFAWTPCVGPALGSVLLMASSAGTSAMGFLLIGVYTLGFVLPFIAVGLFTGAVLDFFKKHGQVVRYTVKVGGALLILMGVMTLTGFMNGVTSYLSNVGSLAGQQDQTTTNEPKEPEPAEPAPDESETQDGAAAQPEDKDVIVAPDFTLTDQFGETHTLSDYKGKTVFLNFWATWCPPCRREMPDIQALYESYGKNAEDLVVLGVANPKTDEHPYNQDVSEAEVTQFLTDNGYSYPVVMDTTGDVFADYAVSAFPTTFMIDKDGNVFGYIVQSLSADMMESIVKQTMEGSAAQ